MNYVFFLLLGSRNCNFFEKDFYQRKELYYSYLHIIYVRY